MYGFYPYRQEIIERTPCGKGWYFYTNNKGWLFYTNNAEINIYKTIQDAMNAIDKRDGNLYSIKGGMIPKRREKPIEIIGKMIFVSDNVDNNGKVQSHYEYEWNNITLPAYNSK